MIHPLTAGQQAVVLGVLAAEHPSAYQCAELLEFDHPIDTDSLIAAINDCLSHYEPLARDYQVHGAIPAAPVIPIVVVTEPVADRYTWAHELIDAAESRHLHGAALTGHHLIVDADGRTIAWIARFHHVIADGFGIHGLLRWIADSHRAGHRLELTTQVAADPRDPAAAEFFATQELSATTLRRGPEEFHRVRAEVRLSAAQRHSARERARALGAGETELYLALAASYIARCNYSPTATIGLPVMNRQPGSAPDLGPRAHVLPLTLHTPPQASLAELLTEASTRLHELRTHSTYRGEWAAADRRAAGQPEHPAGPDINIRPYAPTFRFAGATATLNTLAVGPIADVELIFQVLSDGGLAILVLALTGTDEPTARAHAERLRHLILADSPPGEVALVAPEEAESRGKEQVLAGPTDLPGLIAATLARRGAEQSTALLSLEHRLSWAQFADRVSALASHLAGLGVGVGDTVAVTLPRSPGLIIAVTAAARLGAAFLAIDPELPETRIATMLRRATPAAIIGAGGIPLRLDGTGEFPHLIQLPPVHPGAEETAYLVFTSGSTGEPKAVTIPQEGIVNRLAWHAAHYAADPDTVLLHKTPVSFDVSVWELLLVGTYGISTAVAPPGAHRDPEALAHVISATGVTVVHFVPSALRGFIALTATRGWSLPRLRKIICSGEAVPPDLPNQVRATLGIGVDNLYGPAEASIDVTAHCCTPGEDPVPMGYPLWNTAIQVRDRAGLPQVPGYDGELVIVGKQVATGYLGDPERSARVFGRDAAGRRTYATGDIGALCADGRLRYRGRRDTQVKIGGQRIEEGEVIAALGAIPGVTGAAVTVAGVGEQARLCAVITGTVEAAEARAQLARTLPSYLVPATIAQVTAIPLTHNGKLDRAAVAQAAEQAPPSAPVVLSGELATVTRIFSEVAGYPAGPEDRFFDIGGTSLNAVTLALRLSETLGVAVHVADVLSHHSPHELAGLIDDRRRDLVGSEAAFGPIFELRAHHSGIPVVCCHPAGGLSWSYVGLLARVPATRGIIALQSPGLRAGEEPAASLSKQAAAVVAQLPEEVDLVGWSVGGVLAHEVAVQLRAAGRRVRRLILLDAYPPAAWQHIPEPNAAELHEGVLAMAGVGPQGKLSGVFAALGEERMSTISAMISHNACLMREHRASFFDGPLTIIVASANHRTFDPALWHPHAAAVSVIAREVTHPEMVSPAIFDLVGELLQ